MEENEKRKEWELSKREFFLRVMKSAKRHLDKPKRKRYEGAAHHYFIPPYEKAVLLCALKDLREKYFNPETDIRKRNQRLKHYADGLKETYEEAVESHKS